MKVQKELAFLKQITLGLFNKQHASFELKTKPCGEGAHGVDITAFDKRYSTVGKNLRLEIQYITSEPTVYVKHSSWENGKSVSKEEAADYIQSILRQKEEEQGIAYSCEQDAVDFYGILDTLSDQVFAPDFFELNVWKNTTLELHEALHAEYNSLLDVYHVHGGVGTATDWNSLKSITTSIEYGKTPQDGKAYLGIFDSIAQYPKRPAGIYPDATLDLLAETLIEQYQGAWNRTQMPL